MKNRLIKLVGVILIIFTLASCGTNSKLVGNWTDGYGAFGAGIQFSENGKVVLRDSGESISGTYKVSGDKIVITVENETVSCPYELDGDMLEIEVNGRTLNLSR